MVCTELRDDLDMARAVLASAGVILPAGHLNEIYDQSGFRYCLPAFCVCEPSNMESAALGGESLHGNSSKIKVRLSTGKDMIVELAGDARVSTLKEQILGENEGFDATIVWLGRKCNDDESICALGIPDGGIIQAMLTKK